jgi:hypothetical protein
VRRSISSLGGGFANLGFTELDHAGSRGRRNMEQSRSWLVMVECLLHSSRMNSAADSPSGTVLISMTVRGYHAWCRDAARSRVSLIAIPRQSWVL